MRAPMRPRATILVKLLAAFAAPTVVLFALFGYVAYEVAREDLDAELGTRLTAHAATAATALSARYLVRLEAGNEEDAGRQRALGRVRELAEATGARFYVFDRAFASKLDTETSIAIGTTYFTAQLDRHEVERVFAEGAAVASVTFEGADGRTYKAGYAPLRDADGAVALAVAAEAPAAYFARLDDLRTRLVRWGVGVAAVVLLAALGMTLVLTRPVRALAAAAERIGRGELDAPIAPSGRDELGVLATTMERMRAQLRDRDARMQQMLAGIAHEVRNPLAGMTLFTGILGDELAGDERAAHVARIARELGYLERVVQEFLDFARRPPPELAAVDARELLDEVTQLVAADAATAGVAVTLAAGAPAALRGDRGQLRRAVLNLARNAVQAAAELAPPGDVTLSATPADGAVVLAVANRGPAIPAEALPRLFEPFFTTRQKGTGLGLAFVREIVTDHRGAVEVACEGGVTTFRVTLPAGEPPGG